MVFVVLWLDSVNIDELCVDGVVNVFVWIDMKRFVLMWCVFCMCMFSGMKKLVLCVIIVCMFGVVLIFVCSFFVMLSVMCFLYVLLLLIVFGFLLLWFGLIVIVSRCMVLFLLDFGVVNL